MFPPGERTDPRGPACVAAAGPARGSRGQAEERHGGARRPGREGGHPAHPLSHSALRGRTPPPVRAQSRLTQRGTALGGTVGIVPAGPDSPSQAARCRRWRLNYVPLRRASPPRAGRSRRGRGLIGRTGGAPFPLRPTELSRAPGKASQSAVLVDRAGSRAGE